MEMKPENIFPVKDQLVLREERQKVWGFRSAVFWFTGLSGSGKSTVAMGVEHALFERKLWPKMLDGDNVRIGISNNLGFKPEDRSENIRRIAEVGKMLCDTNLIVLACFISPTIETRERAKSIIGSANFYEIYVKAPVSVCEDRDVKGLYKKARAGEISNFTGVSAPYEPPKKPDLVLDTEVESLNESRMKALNFIEGKVRI
ncbi:MAG: adenylyl-sulfate kinase [Bacteroidetes bacterium]|jgi:adenylylsulfate kinase|nr:adenylyl-sulfate kinase [Bacteroidota bacterium]